MLGHVSKATTTSLLFSPVINNFLMCLKKFWLKHCASYAHIYMYICMYLGKTVLPLLLKQLFFLPCPPPSFSAPSSLPSLSHSINTVLHWDSPGRHFLWSRPVFYLHRPPPRPPYLLCDCTEWQQWRHQLQLL